MKIPISKIRFVLLWTMLTVVAVGCSKVDDFGEGERLLEGKYPLELTSAMSQMLSRATVDNTWAGTEEVAMMVAETSSTTIKNYTASSTGTLTAKTGTEPFYWKLSNETKTISAWFPHSTSAPTSFTIKTDQSSTGYSESDFLYATPKTIRFTDATKSLTFKHLSTKVVINIKKGDGVTDTEMQSATVSIANQSLTSGAITLSSGAVAQTASGASTITPSAIATPPTGFSKSFQALLVPCQMQDKIFIKVTIGSDTFGYTPKNATDGNLQSGNSYTYNITVKRNGLEVTVATGGTWTGGSSSDIESQQIPIIGDYYYSDKTFSTIYNKNKTCIGIIFWVDDNGGGKIVSFDEGYALWSKQNINIETSNDDGKGNTDKLVNIGIEHYPAAQWCTNKGDDWYLPSINELTEISSNQTTINTKLNSVSATTLNGIYCSSSQWVESTVQCFDFANIKMVIYQKEVKKKIRAIAAFNK